MTTPRYCAFKDKSVVSKQVLEFAESANYREVFGGIIAAAVPPALLSKDAFMVSFISRFKCAEANKISIFKFNPNTCYYWHVDGLRSAAVNMLLSGYDSACYFGAPKPGGVYMENVEELKYVPDTYYFFNTARHHTVFNFTEPRYLLSIGIPKDFSGDEVFNYMQENNL